MSLLATVAFAASLAPDQVRVELPDLERARQPRPVTVPFIDPQMVSIGKDKLGVTTFFEMFNHLREAGLLKTELGTSIRKINFRFNFHMLTPLHFLVAEYKTDEEIDNWTPAMTLVTVDDATFEAWLPENAERDALREDIPLMRQIVANQVISRRISEDDIPAGENLLVQTVDEVGLTFSKDEEGNNSVTPNLSKNDDWFCPFP